MSNFFLSGRQNAFGLFRLSQVKDGRCETFFTATPDYNFQGERNEWFKGNFTLLKSRNTYNIALCAINNQLTNEIE